MEKETKPTKNKTGRNRKLKILTLIVGATILADATDMPSRLLNFYDNSKSKVYSIFSKSDAERVNNNYQKATYSIENLSPEMKKELFVNYINNDTTGTYKTLLGSISDDKLDTLIMGVSLDNSIQKNPRWVVSMYSHLEKKDKWTAVKGITKDAVSFR